MRQSETFEGFLDEDSSKTFNLAKKEAWRKSESGREDSHPQGATVVAQARQLMLAMDANEARCCALELRWPTVSYYMVSSRWIQ